METNLSVTQILALRMAQALLRKIFDESAYFYQVSLKSEPIDEKSSENSVTIKGHAMHILGEDYLTLDCQMCVPNPSLDWKPVRIDVVWDEGDVEQETDGPVTFHFIPDEDDSKTWCIRGEKETPFKTNPNPIDPLKVYRC